MIWWLLLSCTLSPPVVEEMDTSALPTVDDFALLDHAGSQFRLTRSRADTVVLFTYGVGCPIARQQLPTLADLANKHPDVEIVLLDANPQDDRAAVATEVDEFGIRWPVLVDQRQLVAESLQIERTAEAIVVDVGSRRVLWRGPIDDRLDYGAQREASRHYLAEVLDAVAAGHLPDLPHKPPKGCLVSLPDSLDARLLSGAGTPTFTQDVAPILRQRCQRCHREGGVAPWSMTSYEVVKGWAPMMREVIRTRRMPPWQADPHVGSFIDDLSLSPEEARTIVHWAEEGTPRGEGSDPLVDNPLPPRPEWAFGEPDLILSLPEQTLPATGVLPYRFFQIPTGLTEEVWVRAAQLRPSNRPVLHHGTVLNLRPEDQKRSGRQALAQGGSKFRQDRVLTHYVPGTDDGEAFPDNAGKRLSPGAVLKFTLHYTTTGRKETDRTELGLYFHDKPPERELLADVAIDTTFKIPPGAEHHPVKAAWKTDKPVLVHKILPHMHLRGSSFTATLIRRNGQQEPLVSLPAYDFNWQRWYTFAEPLRMEPGDRIRANGIFDNSAHNPANPDPTKTVRFGQQTADEMFIGFITYELAPSDEAPD